MKKRLSSVTRRACKGAGLIEYGLLAGLISVFSVVAVSALGDRTHSIFCNAAESVSPSKAFTCDAPDNSVPEFIGSISDLPDALTLDEPISPVDLVWFRDADSDVLAFSSSGLPPGLSMSIIDAETVRIFGAPESSSGGGFTMSAEDPSGASTTSPAWEWEVLEPNDPPVFIENSVNRNTLVYLYQGEEIREPEREKEWFSDPENDDLSVSATGLPEGVTVSWADNDAVHFSGVPEQTGEGMFSLTVTDQRGRTATSPEVPWKVVMSPPAEIPFTMTTTTRDNQYRVGYYEGKNGSSISDHDQHFGTITSLYERVKDADYRESMSSVLQIDSSDEMVVEHPSEIRYAGYSVSCAVSEQVLDTSRRFPLNDDRIFIYESSDYVYITWDGDKFGSRTHRPWFNYNSQYFCKLVR